MKKFAKLCLILSLLGTAVMPVFAQKRVEMAAAASYKANWGQREVTCTSLSNDAVAFYKLEDSYAYEDMCLNAGGNSQSNAHQSALYRELQSMMKSEHDTITTYDGTKNMYQYTDCISGNTSKVSLFYLGDMVTGAWGSAYNREHIWPRSKCINQNKKEDSADIMTLRPTNSNENSSRGNTAYGYRADGYYDPNDPKKDDSSGNNKGQKIRGDCARMLLYNYTRWGNTALFGAANVIQSKEVLLKWMQEDPVDTWEMGRNDSVQSITGTRNVFVDYPEYAWLLFGEKVPTNMVTPSGKASGGTATPDLPDTPVTPDPEPDTPTTPTTPAEIVKAAYALASGESLDGSYTLTGKITEVDDYTNPTIVVEGMEDKPLYCYKLKDDRFEVGDTITVRGTIKNYNGTVEFDTPTLIELIKGQETPDTPVIPDEPDTPVTPDVPVTPDEPDRPDLPEEEENTCAHEYGEWFVIIPATQVTEGEKERYCELCGEKQSETIPYVAIDEETSDNKEEDSGSNGGVLGGLNIGCQSTVGGSLAGIALAAVGALLIKRKKENE